MTTATKERNPGRRAIFAIAAFALAGFLAHCAGAPPDPRPIDADANSFSAERARASLVRMLGDEAPHPVGSAAHALVLERLLDELRAIGVEPSVQESLVAGRGGIVTRVRNVVATIPGTRAGPSIAIAAHHDSVAAGPGASDDGAGVAAAIECVRAIQAGKPLAHTLVFLVTDGEEVDLSGASAFVREHPLARDIRAVVNLEARGTEGLAHLFQTGPGVGEALARFGSIADRPTTSSIAALVYDKLPNDTDLTVFLRAGWTGLNFAFIGGFRRYHTPLDDLAHLDVRSLQHLGEGALAGLRALDALDLTIPHADRGERVWHDVLGRFVIGWPRAWSASLAVLALASLLAAAWRAARAAPRLARADMIWGAAAVTLGITASALLVFGFAAAQSRWHDAADPWFAALDPWSAACLVLALLGAVLGCALPPARRARPAHVYLGAWLTCALVGVVAALIEPAACLLFVAPALVAGVAGWFVSASATTARLVAVVLVSFAALAAIWLPFLRGVQEALGFSAGFVPGALAGAVAAALAPLFLETSRRVLAALTASAVLAFVALALLPDRTASAPIWTNTVHVQTEDAADWAFATYGAELPPPLRAEDGRLERLVPWARWIPTTHVTTAPRHAEPAPRAEVTVLETSDIHRRLRLKLTSPRGATTFVLGFPDGAVEVAGIRSGDFGLQGRSPQSSPLTFVGIGPEGVEIELVQLDRGDWRFHLADACSGWPVELAAPFAPDPTRVPRGRGDVSIVATTFAP